jgi:hypothetical protein
MSADIFDFSTEFLKVSQESYLRYNTMLANLFTHSRMLRALSATRLRVSPVSPMICKFFQSFPLHFKASIGAVS